MILNLLKLLKNKKATGFDISLMFKIAIVVIVILIGLGLYSIFIGNAFQAGDVVSNAVTRGG